jgi:SAM-dependent methyltransferase
LAVGVLEQVACDVCGAEGAAPVFRRPDAMRVVECEECGLMYLSPRPKNSAIESWYGGDYFSGDATKAGRGYTNYFAEDGLSDLLFAARQKLAVVSRHFTFKGASVLELGCATGETCYAVSREGARVVGCDLSLDAIQVARRRYPDLEFHTGSTEHLPFAPASFDAVLAFELIEHVSGPSAVVREVYRVL